MKHGNDEVSSAICSFRDPTVLDRLLEISELFQRDMAREFDGTSPPTARTRVLWDLAHSGPSTQQALATRLEVSARNITGSSTRSTAGYVDRVAASDRSRRVVLGPSPRPRRPSHARDAARPRGAQRALLAAVAPADREALVRGVDAVAARLRELVAAAEAGARRPTCKGGAA